LGPILVSFGFGHFFYKQHCRNHLALTFGNYVLIEIANLMDDQNVHVRDYVSVDYFNPYCKEHEKTWPAIMIAINLILIVAFLNCFNTNISRVILDICSFFTICGFIAVVMGSMNYLRSDGKWQGTLTFEDSTAELGNYGQAIYWGLFPYRGWNSLNFVTSEMKNPKRDLPMALITSIFILAVLYLLITTSIYSIVPKDELLSNAAYALEFVRELFGVWASYLIIMLCIILTIFNIFNGWVIVVSRVIVCAAEDHQLPRFFSMLQRKSNAPIPSVLLLTLLTLIFLTFPTDRIIDWISFIEIVGTAVTCIGVAVLRKTKPEWDRPNRISLIFPFLYVSLSLTVIIFAIQDSYVDFAISLAIMFITVPAYFIKTNFWSKKKASTGFRYEIKNAFAKISLFLQKLFLIASSASEEMPLDPTINPTIAGPITNDSSSNSALSHDTDVKIEIENDANSNKKASKDETS